MAGCPLTSYPGQITKIQILWSFFLGFMGHWLLVKSYMDKFLVGRQHWYGYHNIVVNFCKYLHV